MVYGYSTGQDLQLPTRKGHRRTSKSHTKVPHLTHPPFTYERQPQHRDHPTLFRIARGFFYVPQNYQHSRNCETDIRSESRIHDFPRNSTVHNQVSYRCTVFRLHSGDSLSINCFFMKAIPKIRHHWQVQFVCSLLCF